MNTVANLKDSIAGILTGINLNTIQNLDGAIERAARTLIQKTDIPEATSREQITLYSGVYDYPISSNIFGGALVDFRPQGETRNSIDYAYKRPIEMFDRIKGIVWGGYTLTLEWDKGVPTLRVAQTKTFPKIQLDSFSDSTKWTLVGGSGLATDNTVYYKAPSSTRFNTTLGGSQATLSRTLTSQIDLTSYEGVGVAFLAVRIPSSTSITSIGVRIGSDSSNYFDVSATTGFNGAFVEGKWQLIALDLASATETGTVDITKIDYVRVYFNYDGSALSKVYLGNLWVALPSPHEMIYQTSAIFISSGSNPAKLITTDADLIVLNDSAYLLLEHEGARAVVLQTGGSLASGIIQSLDKILDGVPSQGILGLYQQYRADNPSEELRSSGSWYD
jgi:hypothetical protein